MIDQERGAILLRVYALGIGMGLVVYGATGAWSAIHGVEDSQFCQLWLCPEEFSSSRVYKLHQEGASGQSALALKEFERALILDPASAYRWADVAESMQQVQRTDNAKYCFQRAVEAAPNNPAILFCAANFYFQIAEYPRMMGYLSAILRNPDLVGYYTPAFLTYARSGIPTAEILNKGIPPAAMAAQAFLRFSLEGGQVDDAEITWKWMADRSLLDEKTAIEYVNFLIKKKQEQRAADAWGEFNRNQMPNYLRTNWIFDGGFEAEPSASPLDWHISSTGDVQSKRVSDTAHDGRWSFEIVFNGTSNVDYHLYQETVLKPGKWRLQGFIRTEGLTTDEGLFLRIYDYLRPSRLYISSSALTGTHDWTRVDREFEIGPETKLVLIEVTRKPSMKFDNKIAGNAWVDSLELSPR